MIRGEGSAVKLNPCQRETSRFNRRIGGGIGRGERKKEEEEEEEKGEERNKKEWKNGKVVSVVTCFAR